MLATESLLARVSAKRREFVLGAIAGLLLLVAALFRPGRPVVPASSPTSARSLVVLPFETQFLEGEPLSYGLADEIAAALASVPGVRVAPAPPFTSRAKDARAVAALVNVGHVLHGAIAREGRNLRLTLRLTSVGEDSTLWTGEFTRDSARLIETENEIAETVARVLRAQLGLPDATPVAVATRDRLAHALVMRAVYLRRQGHRPALDTAAQMLEQAVRRDSSYARAWSMLGAVLATLADSARGGAATHRAWALVAAQRAVQLDSALAEPHVTMGRVHAARGDTSRAIAAYLIAIRRDPRLASARYEYSRLLAAWRGRRFDEAIREARRAHELDPLASDIHLNYAQMLARGRREADAEHELAELKRTANYLGAHRTHP